ncbi:hypothetical protein SANTM175S_04198 [Streptomyces antimycoticus]
MKSSPTTPGGTIRSRESRTWTRMLSSGRPIGTTSGTSSARDIGKNVAKVVVSVGPYPSTTVSPGQRSSTRRTEAAGTTSPPVHTSRSPAKQSGASCASSRNSPAVSQSPVIPCAATSPRRAAASSSPGVTTTRPPPSSGTHIS